MLSEPIGGISTVTVVLVSPISINGLVVHSTVTPSRTTSSHEGLSIAWKVVAGEQDLSMVRL